MNKGVEFLSPATISYLILLNDCIGMNQEFDHDSKLAQYVS